MMIRRYRKEDREALIQILRLNTPTYFHPSEEAEFIRYLNEELEDYWVCENEGRVVGSGGVNYFPADRIARISWDMIHPEEHGKGIGSQLLQHRIETLKQNAAINQIMVRTSQLVYPFYEKAGFVLQQTQKDFWAPGMDLYQMTMNIDS